MTFDSLEQSFVMSLIRPRQAAIRIEAAKGRIMPLTFTNLGFVLCHIYDYPFSCAVYLPTVERYEADTQCIVAVPSTHSESEEASLHQSCLDHGFKNWLNIAVVSDTCDDAPGQTEASLIAAFNEDCREGGWLWNNMNYRNEQNFMT